MTIVGLQAGTTCTVQWASSLTEPGRTNWHSLESVDVTNFFTTTEWPVFFRAVGTANTNLANGLVAYYPFNGNAEDAGGNGNTGTVYGAQLAANRFGQANGAYAFDGDDYIDTGVQLNVLAAPISVSLWAYISNSNTNRTYLFGHQGPALPTYDEYHMSVDGTGATASVYFTAFGGDGSRATAAGVTKGAWTHIVSVARQSPFMHRLYVNGVAHNGTSEGVSSTLTDFYIGGAKLQVGPPSYFNGLVDDVRIYNRVLTSNDVWKLRNLPY